MQTSYLLGPTTCKVMQRNVWKTMQPLHEVATPCMDDHQFKEEENESVEELSTVCSLFVVKCLYLPRIGRDDILWSVNKLAQLQNGQKLATNAFGASDLVHSSHK